MPGLGTCAEVVDRGPDVIKDLGCCLNRFPEGSFVSSPPSLLGEPNFNAFDVGHKAVLFRAVDMSSELSNEID